MTATCIQTRLRPWLMALLLCAPLPATAAPPEAAGTAQLHVQTDPEGAAVTLNGISKGVSPLALAGLAAGQHLLVITRPGYYPEYRTFDLKAEDRSIQTFKLEPVKGLVLIKSTPATVDVELEGARRGQTPMLLADLPLGTYRLRFSASGYLPQERALEIENRNPIKIEVTLKASTADYLIESTPPGASIRLNGDERGVTPATIERIPAGESTLELQLDGHLPFRTTLRVQANVPGKLTALLQPMLAQLRVVSLPAGARVYVDNQFKGETPLDITDLAPGDYRLRAELDGHEPMARTVTLSLGVNTSEEFRLISISGAIEIVTEPAGVRIALNGKPAGTTQPRAPDAPPLAPSAPLLLNRLNEGAYAVELSRDGYHSKSLRLEVKRNETVRAREILTKQFIPNYRIVTTTGEEITGVFVELDDTRTLKLEIRPGIIKSFPPGALRSSSRITTP